ncbi:MAG: NAD(P)H-dependent oxidoreductase subunit E [Christensenellales bacterium]|jgi:NADH-quinone oxidoreductase subunit E
MNASFDVKQMDEILAKHGKQASNIIAILQDVQEAYRYLPREIFPYLSKELGMTTANIYSVATFYENFSLEPKGKYVIKVCNGTACHVRKSIPILEKLRETLKLKEGQHTTDDFVFTVETVSCLGACGLAPVLMVNDTVYPSMTPEKVVALVQELREG